MELTGKIILDDATLNTLKREIRKEVINDIDENGVKVSEAKILLAKIDSVRVFSNIFEEALSDFIELKEDNIDSFENQTFNKLKMCYDILTKL